jgi:hypothetical protein
LSLCPVPIVPLTGIIISMDRIGFASAMRGKSRVPLICLKERELRNWSIYLGILIHFGV